MNKIFTTTLVFATSLAAYNAFGQAQGAPAPDHSANACEALAKPFQKKISDVQTAMTNKAAEERKKISDYKSSAEQGAQALYSALLANRRGEENHYSAFSSLLKDYTDSFPARPELAVAVDATYPDLLDDALNDGHNTPQWILNHGHVPSDAELATGIPEAQGPIACGENSGNYLTTIGGKAVLHVYRAFEDPDMLAVGKDKPVYYLTNIDLQNGTTETQPIDRNPDPRFGVETVVGMSTTRLPLTDLGRQLQGYEDQLKRGEAICQGVGTPEVKGGPTVVYNPAETKW